MSMTMRRSTSGEQRRSQRARATPTVAVIIPAYNAAPQIAAVLAAARVAAGGAEIVVVDPGSTDGTAARAAAAGARVLRMGRRAGPAAARNAGAANVAADVLFFLDSDCVVRADALDRVRAAFAAHPRLVSLTGSYDDAPSDPGFFSQYKNLRHHYTHHVAARENATFWGACGAVRADVFRAAGGFDAARYPRPMIEDIELGLRLREYGDTRLDPELRVTHLKRWTLRSLVATELLCRALPWSRLIVERGELPDDLNLRTSQRVAALLAPFALLSLVGAPVAAALDARWLPLPLAVLTLSLVAGHGLYAFFARKRGPWFVARAWLFHQHHLTYSAATLAFVTVQHALRVALPGATQPVGTPAQAAEGSCRASLPR